MNIEWCTMKIPVAFGDPPTHVSTGLGAPWWNHWRNSLLQAVLHLHQTQALTNIRQQTSAIWDFHHVPVTPSLVK